MQYAAHVFVMRTDDGRERNLVAGGGEHDQRLSLVNRAARHGRHITWMHGEGQAIKAARNIVDAGDPLAGRDSPAGG